MLWCENSLKLLNLHFCYLRGIIISMREGKPLYKGSEEMSKMNFADVISNLIERLETTVRENERLKIENERLKAELEQLKQSK